MDNFFTVCGFVLVTCLLSHNVPDSPVERQQSDELMMHHEADKTRIESQRHDALPDSLTTI